MFQQSFYFPGIAPFVIRKFQPKLLYVTCTFISALSMATLGLIAYLNTYHSDLPYLKSFSWIPLATIMVSVVMRAAGVLPVLHTLMSEVYPTEIRTQSIGITQATFLAMGAIGVKLFPEMKNSMGIHGLCLLYCAMGLINAMWGVITIPDNRGKSLVKVEEYYEKKNITPQHAEEQQQKSQTDLDKKSHMKM